jgi:hypothetical protein
VTRAITFSGIVEREEASFLLCGLSRLKRRSQNRATVNYSGQAGIWVSLCAQIRAPILKCRGGLGHIVGLSCAMHKTRIGDFRLSQQCLIALALAFFGRDPDFRIAYPRASFLEYHSSRMMANPGTRSSEQVWR